MKSKVNKYNKTTKNGKIVLVKQYERNVFKIKKFLKNNSNKTLPNKIDIVKFVIKDLNIKDINKAKKISNLLYITLNKRNNNNESKFNFYYGNGDNINLQNSNKIENGDIFYNQKIDKNEPWGKTLKRKNLVIMQIDRPIEDNEKEKGKLFGIKFMKPIENGKKLKTEYKKLYASDIFKILMRGK